jgi:hypothetical protein
LHQLKLLVFQNIINVQQTSFSVLADIVSVKRAFVTECETAEIILMNKAVSHAFQGDASVLPANFNVTTMYVNLFFPLNLNQFINNLRIMKKIELYYELKSIFELSPSFIQINAVLYCIS